MIKAHKKGNEIEFFFSNIALMLIK